MNTSNNNDTTLAELRADVRSMSKTLERLAGAVERLSVIEAQNASRDNTLKDHESRIRGLEVNGWKLAGALVLISVAGPVLARAAGWI
jgi:hypothetical protein